MNMGRYCKAYPIQRLRQYRDWRENLQNLRKETRESEGDEVKLPRELGDSDFLYLQENFVVTDGVFKDENIIYDDVTEEWVEFCKSTLNFQPPSDESA
jgi:hypothetical protein